MASHELVGCFINGNTCYACALTIGAKKVQPYCNDLSNKKYKKKLQYFNLHSTLLKPPAFLLVWNHNFEILKTEHYSYPIRWYPLPTEASFLRRTTSDVHNLRCMLHFWNDSIRMIWTASLHSHEDGTLIHCSWNASFAIHRNYQKEKWNPIVDNSTKSRIEGDACKK